MMTEISLSIRAKRMILMMVNDALLILGAYLIGSIPTGYLVAKLAGIADIRDYGSGNIGATNVARMLGIHFFFLVLFIDAIKAYLYIRYAQNIIVAPKQISIIAFSLLMGNIFPVFLGFVGGKGVATSVGIVAALMPGIWAYVLALWLAVLALTKTVGIASVAGCLALPIIACYYYGLVHSYVFLSVAIAGTLVITHRENINRFLERLVS